MPSWVKFVAALALAALVSTPAAALVSCASSQTESCSAHARHAPVPKVQRGTQACCSLQAPTAPAKRADVRIVDDLARILELTVAVTPQVDPETVLPVAASLSSRSAPQRFFALLI